MSSKNRREIVADFFRQIEKGRSGDGLKYFAANCVQHNPYVNGGMDALLDSMTAVQREQGEFAEPNILLKREFCAKGDGFA
jgi:predicted SnoaL-like aldol condensation-catalyzing enzyme